MLWTKFMYIYSFPLGNNLNITINWLIYQIVLPVLWSWMVFKIYTEKKRKKEYRWSLVECWIQTSLFFSKNILEKEPFHLERALNSYIEYGTRIKSCVCVCILMNAGRNKRLWRQALICYLLESITSDIWLWGTDDLATHAMNHVNDKILFIVSVT